MFKANTTYFEGVSTPPEDSEYTADELDALAEQYNAEQKQNYCERQEKKYDRISKYSLDEENQRIYGARAKAFGDKAEKFKKLSDSINIPAETVENSGESGIINAEMYRKKSEAHRRLGSEGQQVIDKPTYNKLTRKFLKRGG